MEESRRRGRPRKQEVKAVETVTVSDLPIEVTNCLHGRSCELIKIIQEIKGKIEPLEKELECASNELQTLLEFMSEHESEPLKVGTKVRTIKDTKIVSNSECKLFPVGTIGEITDVQLSNENRYLYAVTADNYDGDVEWWYYTRDMFVVVEDEE